MLLMQRTGALPIDHVVDRGAVALAGDLGLATLEQLDIAGEHDRYGLVDAAVALRQGLFGLGGDRGHRRPESLAGWGLAVVMGPGVAFEVVGCYDCHWVISWCLVHS